MKHEPTIMICKHVIDENRPIGQMDEELKTSTLVCQKRIDKMDLNPNEPAHLTPDVGLACRCCVLRVLNKE